MPSNRSDVGAARPFASQPRVAPASVMSEAQLQEAVIDAAHLFGWLVHHVKPARTPDGKWLTRIQGDRGFPDLVLARTGEVLFVELKSAKGRVRPEQQEWLDRLPRSLVWRPEDWTNGTITAALR